MTAQNIACLLRIMRVLPRIWLKVCLQAIGAVALIFATTLLFPGQKGLAGLVGIAYIVWSSLRLDRYISRL